MRTIMYRVVSLIIVLGVVSLFGIATPPVMAQGKVLLVHSYHSGYPWVDSISEGVKQGFEGSDVNLEIFYMDTKRKTSEKWKADAGELAKQKVAEFKPEVIITTDDNAQTYFAKDYAGKSKPSVVFCGVNAEPAKYGYPADNVTGILERPHYVRTLKMLLSIMGDIKTVAVLSDDGPTSTAMFDYMKKQKLPEGLKVVSYDQPSTFAKWKKIVKKYQETVDAIGINMYHTVKRKANDEESIDFKEVIEWTVANNKKPTFGFFPFCIEDGCLCGIVESGEEHGFEAAQMALAILKGKKAGDIPIKLAKKGTVMLNVKTADALGVGIPDEIVKTTDKIIE